MIFELEATVVSVLGIFISGGSEKGWSVPR